MSETKTIKVTQEELVLLLAALARYRRWNAKEAARGLTPASKLFHKLALDAALLIEKLVK